MQPLQEKLLQMLTRISLVNSVRMNESLAGDIVVMACKWYCCKDVNALAPRLIMLVLAVHFVYPYLN